MGNPVFLRHITLFLSLGGNLQAIVRVGLQPECCGAGAGMPGSSEGRRRAAIAVCAGVQRGDGLVWEREWRSIGSGREEQPRF